MTLESGLLLLLVAVVAHCHLLLVLRTRHNSHADSGMGWSVRLGTVSEPRLHTAAEAYNGLPSQRGKYVAHFGTDFARGCIESFCTI